MTVTYLACLALGYLIGSLSVSILISKYIFHQDVRTLGSGNAGAANAARTRKSADRFFLDSAAISLYNIVKRYRVTILEPLRKGGIICRADRWKI